MKRKNKEKERTKDRYYQVIRNTDNVLRVVGKCIALKNKIKNERSENKEAKN